MYIFVIFKSLSTCCLTVTVLLYGGYRVKGAPVRGRSTDPHHAKIVLSFHLGYCHCPVSRTDLPQQQSLTHLNDSPSPTSTTVPHPPQQQSLTHLNDNPSPTSTTVPHPPQRQSLTHLNDSPSPYSTTIPHPPQ